MVPARCKLAYIRAGIIAIIGSGSDLTYFLVANEMQTSLSSRCPRGLTAPPHKIVRAHASKISTDECINIRKSWTLKDAFLLQNPENVKIRLKIGRIM